MWLIELLKQIFGGRPSRIETEIKIEVEIEYKKTSEGKPNYPLYLIGNSTSIYELINRKQELLKGVMEDYFFEFLKLEFKSEVSNDKSIQIEESEITPDFILNSEKGLLAIEIDEPYSIGDGANELIPIHYIGKDETRNRVLKANGISIIRFSEKQIVQQPEKCISVIRKFHFQDSVENLHLTFQDPRWNIEDAKDMITKNYRNSYLPFDLHPRTQKYKVDKYSFRQFKINTIHATEIKGDYFGKVKFGLEAYPSDLKTIIDIDSILEKLQIYPLTNIFQLCENGVLTPGDEKNPDDADTFFAYLMLLIQFSNVKISGFGIENGNYFNFQKQKFEFGFPGDIERILEEINDSERRKNKRYNNRNKRNNLKS